MQPSFLKAAAFLGGLLLQLGTAQQYAGDVIPNSLPSVPGSELVYFKIAEPNGKVPKAYNLTLTNYQSLQANGKQLVPAQLQRAVIIIHGLQRDPGTYISNIMSALADVTDPNINRSSVALMAPYFPNGDDKNYGYPYNETNPNAPGKTYSGAARSYTGALVWQGSAWSGGGANQYPAAYTTLSSYYVIDQLLLWFSNKTMFPNMKEIVVAGHSLGGQTVQRYAVAGVPLSTLGVSVPVTYWIANPNSYVWLNSSRPLSTASCSDYDQWRDGLQNFTGYTSPASYNSKIMTSSVTTIQNNYYGKNKAYARGLLDTGDDSSGCEPEVSGSNRNERFFAFINWFPPTCPAPNSTTGHCDTVDFMNIGHDAGAMMASSAGLARLFSDNFYGNGSRAYDFGYPRVQAGDDPYPNPALASNTSAATAVYAGNMTLQGCYSDNSATRALTHQMYDWSNNTIELCTSTCYNAGYLVAGVEYGSQCYCDNALTGSTEMVVPAACSLACAGNSSETCGAASRINIYSNGQPKQLAAPGNPDSVDNANYNYLSCYSEATSGRALSAKSYSDTKNMTLDNCASFCSGYKYFGIEYSQECYCGGCFNAGSAIIDSSKCSMTCTGDTSEYCGGSNALSVYQIDESSNLKPISQTCAAGSTATTTGTATGAVSSSAVPTASLCPAVNGQNIVDANNNTYLVTCSSDSSFGSYGSSTATNSYLDCMAACDAQSSSGCKGFTYVGGVNGSGSGTCWLKTSMGTYSSTGSNYIAAALVSSGSTSSSTVTASSSSTSAVSTATGSAVSCPASNQTVYNATNGAQFLIECGIDHNGGDMGSVTAYDFASCINACATTAKCVDVSLSGTACYLKSTLGPASSSPNVLGAKLISSGSSSSTVSSTSSTGSTSSLSSSTTSVASSTSSSSVFPSATATTCPGMDQSSLVDSNGAVYNIYCSTDTGSTTLATISTSTGILGCMSGCDAQAGCTAFTFAASDSKMTSGFCYLRTVAAFSSSSATTAVAVQVLPPGSVSVKLSSSSSSLSSGAVSSTLSSAASSSSPSTVITSSSTTSVASSTSSVFPSATATTCPGMDQSSLVDSNGAVYNIYCSTDTGSTTLATISTSTGILGCMSGCDAQTGCTSFTYAASDSKMTSGFCYLRTVAARSSAGATTVVAVQVLPPGSVSGSSSSSAVSSTTTSSASSSFSSSASSTSSSASSSSTTVVSSSTTSSAASSSSTASSTTQSASSTTSAFPSATASTCPGMDKSSMVDANGNTYNIYCSADTANTVITVTSTTTGILGCMANCDKTTGCTAFTYAGDSTMTSGFCYLRTIGARSSSGSTTAVAQLVSTGSGASSSSSSTFATVQTNANIVSQSASSSSTLSTVSSSTITSSTTTSSTTTSSTTTSSTATSTSSAATSSTTSSSTTSSSIDSSSSTASSSTTSSSDASSSTSTSSGTTSSSTDAGTTTTSSSSTTSSSVSSSISTTSSVASSTSSTVSTTFSTSSTTSPSVTSTTSTTSKASSTTSTTSSTVSIKPSAPAVVGNYQSIGCYNDTVSARALKSTYTYGSTSNPMTLEKCAAYCASYTYWGVEYGQECYCGTVLSNGSQNYTTNKCTMTCPGNSTELCGAGNALQMYSMIASSTSTSAVSQGTGTSQRRRRRSACN